MGVDFGRLTRQATIASSFLLMVAFALGILAFALALRPCRLSVPAGELVPYTLTTTTCELKEDDSAGPARIDSRTLQLVGTGNENEVALISPSPDNDPHRASICLMDMSPDGAAFRLDAAARPMDTGMAIGFFDFNLMPLSESAEQSHDVQIDYAVVPARRNPVQGRVKRTKSGAKPEFRMTLQSSVEWVSDESYHQIRDLVASYRFNTSLGIIDHATITMVAGVERADGRHRYHVRMDLQLAGSPGKTSEDPARLRETVLASAEAQALLRADDHDRSGEVAQRLRQADIALPELRTLADRIAEAILQPAPPAPAAWCLCVARGPESEHLEAAALGHRLAAAGFASRVVGVGGDDIAVEVGPYPAQDPGALAAVARRFPGFSPRWVEAQ